MEFKKYCISLSPGSRIDRELVEALESLPEDYRCLLVRQLLLEGFKANKSLSVVSLPAPVAVAITQPVAQPAPAPVARPVPRTAAPRPAPQPEPESRDEIIELPELAPALDALADDDDEDPMAKLRNILSKTA